MRCFSLLITNKQRKVLTFLVQYFENKWLLNVVAISLLVACSSLALL